MPDENLNASIPVSVTPETLERIEYLARVSGMSFDEMAEKLLAEQAEAEAGLQRGPYLRKYMHR